MIGILSPLDIVVELLDNVILSFKRGLVLSLKVSLKYFKLVGFVVLDNVDLSRGSFCHFLNYHEVVIVGYKL